MGIAGMDFTQNLNCFLHQSNLLLGVLFQHRTGIQQAGTVSRCANGSIGQDRGHFLDDRLHTRFIAVLVHILEHILQEQQILSSIVLADCCDDAFNGVEHLLVIHKIQAVHQADFLQAVQQRRATAHRGFQFLHRNFLDHGMQ